MIFFQDFKSNDIKQLELHRKQPLDMVDNNSFFKRF